MAMRTTSLGTPLAGFPEPCQYEPELGQVVHRFNGGSRVCRCGRLDVPEPRFDRIPSNQHRKPRDK